MQGFEEGFEEGSSPTLGVGQELVADTCNALQPAAEQGHDHDPELQDYDRELEAMLIMIALAQGNAAGVRSLCDALMRLSKARRRKDPSGAERALRMVLRQGMTIERPRSRLAVVRAAWREMETLPPPHRSDDLFGFLDAIETASRSALRTEPQSLPMQAYVLAGIQDVCVRHFWQALAGQAAGVGYIEWEFRRWSVLCIASALTRKGSPLAPAFLYLALLWNWDLASGRRSIQAEIARIASRLPLGPRELLLLLVLREAEDGLRCAKGYADYSANKANGYQSRAARNASRLRAEERAVGRLNWVVSYLAQTELQESLKEVRALYGRVDAEKELTRLLPRAKIQFFHRPLLVWNSDAHPAVTLARMYEEVMRPSVARKIISAWQKASGHVGAA